MKESYIFIKTELSLEELANFLRKVYNINNKNISSHIKDQKRFGLNMGGEYYLFEFIGLEFYLIKNEGEMFENKFSNYNYYLMLYWGNELRNDLELKYLIKYLTYLLKEANLTVHMEFELN